MSAVHVMPTEVELSTNNKSRDEIALPGDKQIPGHARAFVLKRERIFGANLQRS